MFIIQRRLALRGAAPDRLRQRAGSNRRQFFASRPPLQPTGKTVSQDNPYDDEVTSVEEFQQRLGQVVRAAAANDIDPSGSWEFRNGAELPDWEAMIVELEKVSADD